MQEYFISNKNFPLFVKSLLDDARVIAPVEFDQRNILAEVTEANIQNINLAGWRAVEPFKSFLFRLTEIAADYFQPGEASQAKKLIFLGARACDIEALEVLDKVLAEGDIIDPSYVAARQNLIIIGADCTDCGKTCFCHLVNGLAYPTKMTDLNFAAAKNGYIVEVANDKGKELIDSLFTEVKEYDAREKQANREKVKASLIRVNRDWPLNKELSLVHKVNLENKAWRSLTKNCVECSACNFACPTCTCFLLVDSAASANYARHKQWDACLKTGYAKVAGGANSRPKLVERLQNRYHCKFDYSHDRLNRYTCVGCGRCIDGCAGNIDMRKIFVELERQAPLTAKLE